VLLEPPCGPGDPHRETKALDLVAPTLWELPNHPIFTKLQRVMCQSLDHPISPTHLPSLMADGCIILKNLSRDLVRGGQLVISALHPLETLNFFVVGVVKISAVSRILLCACRYYNNFLSPTFLFMRKQLYM